MSRWILRQRAGDVLRPQLARVSDPAPRAVPKVSLRPPNARSPHALRPAQFYRFANGSFPLPRGLGFPYPPTLS